MRRWPWWATAFSRWRSGSPSPPFWLQASVSTAGHHGWRAGDAAGILSPGRPQNRHFESRVMANEEEAPVVIAGGGLIGLTTAMFLAQQGVRSIALERMTAPST